MKVIPTEPTIPPIRVLARTAWAWSGSFASMSVSLGTLVLLEPVRPFPRSYPGIPRKMMGLCLRLTGSSVTLYHDEGFDPQRPSVLCQNHVSVLDAHAAVTAMPCGFCGMMEEWHFKIPIYGWIMGVTRGIAVPRGSQRYRVIAEQARARIAGGLSILTFPEAHRTLDGRLRRFRRGPFFMARDAGAPVVPLAVRGLYPVNHKGTALIRPGRIDIYVGPQLETAGLDDEQLADLAERTREIMVDFVERGRLPPTARRVRG